jgi:hypothetical protein
MIIRDYNLLGRVSLEVLTVTIRERWARYNTDECHIGLYYTIACFQVEELAAGDMTAVNKMSVVCRGPGLEGSNEIHLEGPIAPEFPGGWGTYGTRSAPCLLGSAVCGLATRVLANQGAAVDDLGVTDVTLYCC